MPFTEQPSFRKRTLLDFQCAYHHERCTTLSQTLSLVTCMAQTMRSTLNTSKTECFPNAQAHERFVFAHHPPKLIETRLWVLQARVKIWRFGHRFFVSHETRSVPPQRALMESSLPSFFLSSCRMNYLETARSAKASCFWVGCRYSSPRIECSQRRSKGIPTKSNAGLWWRALTCRVICCSVNNELLPMNNRSYHAHKCASLLVFRFLVKESAY